MCVETNEYIEYNAAIYTFKGIRVEPRPDLNVENTMRRDIFD